MSNISLNTIHNDLKFLKKELIEIKKHMVDADTLLTPDENAELEKSIKNYKKRKTKSPDKFKEELGL